MNTELTNNQVFGGQRDLGFRFEANSTGTATLQFKKSDGSWVAESSTDQLTTDQLFRLDLFTDQKYRWVIAAPGKMYREPK